MPETLGSLAQPRILGELLAPALFLTFSCRDDSDPRPGLARLRDLLDPERSVVGLGAPLVAELDTSVPGLRGFEPVVGRGVAWPSTQGGLWVGLYGGDEGTLLHEARAVVAAVAPHLGIDDHAGCFQHREGRDLSGFIDGTANPVDEAAVEAALTEGQPGLAGGSFVHVMRWVHDLDAIAAMSQHQRDRTIGRRISDNEEIEDAPESAHVKRTAQEDVGFLLRRSMPWGGLDQAGLIFIAYARDPDTFSRHARRMVGLEDGVVDALYSMTRPVSGGLYWCPPMARGRLDLSALGL